MIEESLKHPDPVQELILWSRVSITPIGEDRYRVEIIPEKG